MVSPPPELDAAVRASLAPWRVKIIVISLASGTPAELALAQRAGFVVWADDSELVLWDASAGVGERRDIPSELDDANAAALALSIKTWMHLGAPPRPGEEPTDPVDDTPPPPGRGGEGAELRDTVLTPSEPLPPALLRVEAASGARGNIADRGRAGMRLAVAGVARIGPVDVALGGEIGPARSLTEGEVVGELSTLDVTAHGRWGVAVGPALTLAPSAGVVLIRTSFSGVDAMDRTYDAAGTTYGLDAAGLLEWRRSWLVVSAELGATYVLVSQELQSRNMRLNTPAHIEPRGLVRVGVVLR